MNYFVGIDLGTTNSAICSYDGVNVRVWKSPEQNDVTPSAIYIDKRGNKYYGSKAYNQAPYNPNNSATLFKRYMGTTQKVAFESANLVMTPEECSAEVLKVLYGYLPEEIRDNPETATVITVPAAFNQMKKNATLKAAELAGIGNVALMQEPVAAIMSIMRHSKQEGIFLVYDLGGGTFDVSIAENIGGKVNLLSHGGIEMCGGRDIDRAIFDRIVDPWLRDSFTLPDDFRTNRKYTAFCRVAQWATERAKIELSSTENSTIALSEGEARAVDEIGDELYLDIDITRQQLNELIFDMVTETINATRDIMAKAGLTSNDIERIVFIGGPTNYKPLRDMVTYELSLRGDTDVNPMTAVAEGASIFAESIDWTTQNHNRKAVNETKTTSIKLSFRYTARTPSDYSKVMCVLKDTSSECTIEFISLDTGWSSGTAKLENNMIVTLPLSKDGQNRFAVKVCDTYGHEKDIGDQEIVITKTLASIGSIPASHSIGVEVIDKLGGISVLEFLVNEGDPLPKKGEITFKAGQTIKTGTNESINIKIWEGNIESPIDDNRFVGVYKISGTDFETGIVPTGAEIVCEYEMSDSGTITLGASVPCIGAFFGSRNFFSCQEAQLDIDNVDAIAEEGKSLLERIDDIEKKISTPQLDEAREKAEFAANIDSQESCDPEEVLKANEELLSAKKLLNQTRRDNLGDIRQMELDSCVGFFDEQVRQYATTSEEHAFDNMAKTAQRSIERGGNDFENVLDNMRAKNTIILFRQDWFVIDWYQRLIGSPANFIDRTKYNNLELLGNKAISEDNIDELRNILFELLSIQIRTDSGEGMYDIANIIKG